MLATLREMLWGPGRAGEHPAVTLLREIEWRGDEDCPTCPCCRCERDADGHMRDCKLASLITRSAPLGTDSTSTPTD